jgi:hypothetical protein
MRMLFHDRGSPVHHFLKTALITKIKDLAFLNVWKPARLDWFAYQGEKILTRHSGDYFTLILVIVASGKDG